MPSPCIGKKLTADALSTPGIAETFYTALVKKSPMLFGSV
jgi:hypothetical protein